MTEKLSIDEIRKDARDYVFVAMDFSRKFSHVYDEVITEAVLDCGLTPIRSDEILSAGGNVIDEIVEVIKLSRAVIVEITGSNPNVLIELGISQAFEKTIIIMTQDQSVPFDLQPKRVVFYSMSKVGSAQAKTDLMTSLRSTVFPKEALLREMLWQGKVDSALSIIHGTPTIEHMASVFPAVSPEYKSRLDRYSSETSGIWHIGLAYQRVAWSLGRDYTNVAAADAARAPDSIMSFGNVILLGGPGTNSYTRKMFEQIDNLLVDMPRIDFEIVDDGKKRFRIYQGDRQFPVHQDEMLLRGTDFGIILRLPNPYCAGAVVWVAAGVRSYGTEGAIRGLTNPSILREARTKLPLDDEQKALWIVVKCDFDQQEQSLISVEYFDGGVAEYRGS